jgi:GDPmannose 4,6-dehydratase
MTTTSNRRALICGVAGQDGSYLAKLLLNKGYDVVGTSRDAIEARLGGLAALGIAPDVRVVSMAPNDFRSVLQTVVRAQPDEIYNLAGQSSVGLSFEQPVEAIESIALGTLNLMEAMRFVESPIRFYNAGSSECFGDTAGQPATWWRTTARRTGCMPAPASCSTTSRRCGPSAS